jgi:hypothetical protein
MNRTGVHVCRILLVVPTMLAMAKCLANAQDSPEVKQWQVFEVEMTAVQNKANPYVAYRQEKNPARVKVRFTGVSGEAAGREMTVAGLQPEPNRSCTLAKRVRAHRGLAGLCHEPTETYRHY